MTKQQWETKAQKEKKSNGGIPFPLMARLLGGGVLRKGFSFGF